jgi:hypothetical protein
MTILSKASICINFVVLVIIVSLYGMYAPLPGFYIPWAERIVCSEKYSCLHEAGHQIDKSNGYPSQTVEYSNAVQTFRIVCETSKNPDSFCTLAVNFPGIGSSHLKGVCHLLTVCGPNGWGGYSEFLSEMYAQAGGEVSRIPEVFRKFYQGGRQ